VLRVDVRDELFFGAPLLSGTDHDARAVRVVSAHVEHTSPGHALKPHPDVRLDVFHEMPDVERGVRVRECARDEKAA